MNAKALHTLEFHKIIDRLTEHAASQSGKDLCRHLTPSDDLSQIRLLQSQTADAFSRILKKGSPSFGGIKDVRGSLKRLEIGSSLNAIELLAVCTLLETAARAKSYGRKDNADLTRDSLDDYFDGLIPLSTISAEIRRCILSEEEISDEASSTLRQIRRSIKLANDRIHTQLNSMVNGSVRTYLQDAVITMRDGRYCLPVKAEYRGQVSGMIHDQSSSGSTVFIEPMAVVRLNNDIKELVLKEQAEIEVILANLSTLVAEETQAVHSDFELLTELDFIFARARLAQDYNGTAPMFNTQ